MDYTLDLKKKSINGSLSAKYWQLSMLYISKASWTKTRRGFCQSSRRKKSPNELPRAASRGHPQVANCSFKNVLSLIKATTATVVHTQQHKNKSHTQAQRFQRMADRVTQRARTLTSLPLLSPLLLLLLLFCLFYGLPSCTLFHTPLSTASKSISIHPEGLWEQVFAPRGAPFWVRLCVYCMRVCGIFVCTCVPLTPSHWRWLLPFFVPSQVVHPSQRQQCNISNKFITSVIWWPSWGVAVYKVWLNMAILIAGVHCNRYHTSTAGYIKYFSMLTNVILESP